MAADYRAIRNVKDAFAEMDVPLKFEVFQRAMLNCVTMETLEASFLSFREYADFATRIDGLVNLSTVTCPASIR